MNAKAMVLEIAHELSELDPQNKSNYEKNAEKMISSLDDLIDQVSTIVPKNPSFIVFHDAYQYFENRFNIKAAGALTLNPEVLPGAKQIAEIQELIEHDNVKCIFSEPQYNPKIIEVLASDMDIITGIIDPLGAVIDAGPVMYDNLILEIANSLKSCA
jgi:zinc transport system substrate-binding protein